MKKNLFAAVVMVMLVACTLHVAAQKPDDEDDTVEPGSASPSSSSSASSWLDDPSSSSYVHRWLIGESRRVRFLSGFIASTSMILVSEFGDKTFFIAAIMAMRHPRWEVFGSAIAALALMTVLSAVMGFTLPHLLNPRITHLLATVLFLFFGCRLLYDAHYMEAGVANLEEMEEVEHELEKKDIDANTAAIELGAVNNNSNTAAANNSGESTSSLLTGVTGRRTSEIDTQRKTQSRVTALVRRCFSPVFIQCFVMTFLAEWGDRSQIATIALAAAKDPVGVTLGGICGHAVCTGVAVLGGKLLATRISERSISIVGGILFLLFAAHSVWFDDAFS